MLEHGQRVMAAAEAYATGAMTADDIFQETYMRAWTKLGPDHDTARNAGWLCQTALNIGRDHWTTVERRKRLLGKWMHRETPEPPRGVGEELVRRALWRAIDALPSRQRSAVLMRDVDELETSEIASRMNIKASTVRATLRDAYKALRMALGFEETPDSDPPQEDEREAS
jgi:RNA polymerase sigma-70 factor, ECF subfamily